MNDIPLHHLPCLVGRDIRSHGEAQGDSNIRAATDEAKDRRYPYSLDWNEIPRTSCAEEVSRADRKHPKCRDFGQMRYMQAIWQMMPKMARAKGPRRPFLSAMEP